MSDLDALRTKVRNRCGITASDNAITDAILTGFINDGLERVSFAGDWWWLEALDTISLADTNTSYTFSAATVRRWVSFSNKFGHVLQVAPVGEVIAQQKVLGDGVPMMCGYEGTTVYFAPGSSGSQNVEGTYVGYETALSGDTDTAALPTEYETVVVEHAAMLTFRNRRMFDEANAAAALFTSAMADMKLTAPLRARSIGGGEPPLIEGA